jgi:signal transduction histidine kinase/ligand-binding sensor domain-containing protein
MLLSIAMDWLLAVATPMYPLMPSVAPVVTAEVPFPPAAPWSTPPFRRYTLAEGLPSSTVYKLRQDSEGFLWIGTSAGLARFDGVSFHVFRHDADDAGSLPANRVSEVFVDRANTVWVGGPDMGFNRLDRKTGSFQSWLHDEGDVGSLASDDVVAIAQTADGSLWAGTGGAGLDRLHEDGRAFDHLRHRADDPESLSSDKVTALLAGDDGRLWIGTAAGLDVRMPDGRLRHVPVEGQDSPLLIRSIDGGVGGEIRVGTDVGLLLLGADGVARRDGQMPGIGVLSSARDKHGSLWLGTMNGIYLVDREGHGFPVPIRSLLPVGLRGSQVWQVSVDRENGLWFALDGGGLAYLGPNWSDFTPFAHAPGLPDNPPGTRATAIAASREGQLWVGGSNGWLRRLDPLSGQAEGVVEKSDSRVDALLEDRAGRVWLATAEGVFVRSDNRQRPVGTDDFRNPVTALLEGPQGRVYAGSSGGGVLEIDPGTLYVSPLKFADPSAEVLETRQIAIEDGLLWQAGTAGLTRWDAAHSRMDFVHGVDKGQVNAFAFDSTGFWLARPAQLEHYHWKEGGAVRSLSVDTAAGWPSPDVLGLRVDAHGRVWIFALTGLWRYDPHRRTFRAFGVSDGLPSTEFTSGNTVRLADGTVYGMTLGGLIGFRPDTQQDFSQPPSVLITDARVRRDGAMQSLSLDGGPLDLRWNDRELQVEVRALSYISPRRNRYRFYLEGFDSSWIDAGNRGERELAGLSAGSYRLLTEAAGRGGLWGEAPPLEITVAAPPWRRWWAWSAYALLAATFSIVMLRESQRRIRQRVEVQLAERQRLMAEQANEAKTRFMTTLSHEIRTPMTGVLGMAELLLHSPLSKTQRGYVDAMRQSGTLLLKLINNALDLARIEAARLELELAPFDPRALLDGLFQLERPQARGKGLDLRLEVISALPARMIGDGTRVQQVLLNLVGNAIKFTDHGQVIIRVQHCPEGLRFSVIDTGPGIPLEHQARMFQRFEQASTPQRSAGSGLGLAICCELVALMGGTIHLESVVGTGSSFHVTLPLVDAGGTAADVPEPGAHGQSKTLRLLLVEDDAIVSEVIRGLLQARGHDVHGVVNGLEALTLLAHTRFDALLLDIELPGMDGFQLARMIRRGKYRAIPIIAITARSYGDEDELTRQAGMDACLRKPVSGEELALVLDSLDDRQEMP